MRNTAKLLLLLGVLLSSYPIFSATISEKTLTIPTYGIDAPDPNPRFYTGRVYQGAQGRIYPYPISDVLTNAKSDRTYRAVYLENDFIRLCVLPEIGGRIFEAVDKTNGYHFFYKQSVIKPSLIGMLGAWISGGVEWNFPHHHRARTFMPVDYKLQQNDDGSVTLWMSEIDYRQRLRLLIGLTLEDDSNLLTVDLKFFNPTPFAHSFLYFANPAVHVDSTYQVIFPPEVEYVVQHAKSEFAGWPISDDHYGEYDYHQVDISWWKNLPKPVSFFAWDHTSDYFGGYDHGKEAGVAYVADVHLAPGKKFFTFGCGEEGRMWDKILTDTDGPYLELMSGAYSDNQPDYSWIQPFEVKTIRQTWFPIRNLEGLSYANRNGALYLALTGDLIRLNLNSTTPIHAATVRIAAKGRTVLEETTFLSPSQPKQYRVRVPFAVEEQEITAEVIAEGIPIMSYTPKTRAGAPRPKPVEPPRPPEDYSSNEELYLTGLRLDQFHNPLIDPLPYYDQVLKRDSLDSRTNTQLGILHIQRGNFHEAEARLLAAVQRITHNYTRPRDAEALYYLGVVRRFLAKDDEAYDAFYRAVWDFAWRSAGYFQLAELDCRKKNWHTALEHIDESLATNARNTRALDLKAMILLKLGQNRKAEEVLQNALALDPLDPWANLLLSTRPDEYAKKLEVETCLEVAAWTASAGFYDKAAALLSAVRDSGSPIVLYDLAYYLAAAGDSSASKNALRQAARCSHKYCFPFRLESIAVLNYALSQLPSAETYTSLGNLYFDLQPQKAMDCWRRAVRLDPRHAPAWRNLGFGYAHSNHDYALAAACYEKSVSLQPEDARLLYELDVIYDNLNVSLEKRLKFFNARRKTVFYRDDALARYVEILVLAGKYDEAIKILRTHLFNVWEGGGEIHNHLVDSHLLRGSRFLKQNRPQQALTDFTAALEYPDNLQVGRPIHDSRSCRTWVLIGQAYRKIGRSDDARRAFEKAAELNVDGDLLYFKALALEELGFPEKAREIFSSLIERGETLLKREADLDFFAKFGEKRTPNKRLAAAHYLIALGMNGLGDRQGALHALHTLTSLDRNNLWANYFLTEWNEKEKMK